MHASHQCRLAAGYRWGAGPRLGSCTVAGSLITHCIAVAPLPRSSVPVGTGARENFSSHLENMRNHLERETKGAEATSSVTSLQREGAHGYCETYCTQHQWQAGHPGAKTKSLHKDRLSSVRYWNYLSAGGAYLPIADCRDPGIRNPTQWQVSEVLLWENTDSACSDCECGRDHTPEHSVDCITLQSSPCFNQSNYPLCIKWSKCFKKKRI